MSNILKFIVKRIFIVYVMLLIVCFFSKYQRISMIFALTMSTIFSLLRFASIERILKLMTSSSKKTGVFVLNLLIYLFLMAAIGVIIVLSLKTGVLTFLAALAGTLIIVIIIMINALTEALGITRNQFGQKVK